MFPGPRTPFPRRTPPRMMGPMPRGNFSPMMGPPGMRGQMRGTRGGLLAKLLGRGGQSGGINPSSAARAMSRASSRGATGGGLLKSLSNPNTINGFLSNTQKVLNTAQQIGPMVQQYGPLVRNLPAMWKIYKGFKDIPSESENDSSAEAADSSRGEVDNRGDLKETNAKRRSKQESNPEPIDETASEEEVTDKGKSIPKLYI